MVRYFLAIGLAIAVAGCSPSEPAIKRQAPMPPASAANNDASAPAEPAPPESKAAEPDKKFNSPEEEIAYWEEKSISEIKQRFVKYDKAAIQKSFDKLSREEKANVERIRSWLPHKRITEMSNVEEDVMTITNNPEQFDVELSLRRLLEYADDSGAYRLLKNLGVTKPKQIVAFRMDFGQVTPDVQAVVWGITQKAKNQGVASLTTSERALFQARRGLFPAFYP
jgi:hypothetical protein